MRRNNNIIKPRDKWKIRGSNNSSIRGGAAKSGGVRSSHLQNEDNKGDRKRMFPDPKTHHLQNITEQHEPVQDPRSDGAKTSEYAYFKKLKKEAARSELYPKDREKSQFTNVQLNNYEREKTMKLKQVCDEQKLSVPIGTERCGDHTCFSPPFRASKSSEMINMVENCDKYIGFPLPNEKVTFSNHNHSPSYFEAYPNDTGVQHYDKGIFALKRRKLHQRVADTLLQESEELSSKGFNLVSMLLNRLFPEDNKENRDWEPKYSQAEISARDQLPLFLDDSAHSRGHYGTHKKRLMESEDAAYEDYHFTRYLSERRRDVILPELDNVGADSPSTTYPIKTYSPCKYMKPYHKIDASITENLFPESNRAQYQLPLFPDDITHSRGHYRMHTNHLKESENVGYQDYCFPRYLSERHRDVILPELDNAGADSPSTTYPIKTYFPCTYMKPYSNLDAPFTESLFPESNLRFQLQSEKYGSIAWADHVKKFDKCHDPNGSLLQGEPHTLLLGWDYSNDKDKQGLSISSYNRNMNLLAHSGDNDHWKSHDRQDESALCSSSLVSSYFLNCNSLPQPSSANFFCTHDSGRYFKYENNLYAKLDQFPVSFSCNPDSIKYLHGLSDDFSMNNLLETRNAVCSPQDHLWNLNQVICENRVRDQESLFFSTSLDRELGEKHLSLGDFSTENQLSIIHAFQNPQHVGPAACFLGEADKKCFLYNPSCTSDYSDTLNFQDLSTLNFQRSCEKGDSIQRHSTRWDFPMLERYHAEADDDSECKFQ